MAHADIVNSWFREHLAGGELGRATEAYNQVHSALPALIEALDKTEGKRLRKAAKSTEADTAASESDTAAT